VNWLFWGIAPLFRRPTLEAFPGLTAGRNGISGLTPFYRAGRGGWQEMLARVLPKTNPRVE
jgi:hypothetical protein